MNCPPDCMICAVTDGEPTALSAAMHHRCKHWKREWLHPSEDVFLMCAMFWRLGRGYERTAAAERRGMAERTAAIIGAELKEAAE